MTGRAGAIDVNRDVAALCRQTLEEVGNDRILIAEHCHDASADLDGHGWHGTMNYAGFRSQVVSWLGDPQSVEPVIDSIDGIAFVRSLRMAWARIPWTSLVASWTLLGSHDTARAQTVFGDSSRHAAAATLLMTLPGTPMIFAGDEFALTGAWGEDARVTMPWEGEYPHDGGMFGCYQQLIALRRNSPALIRGGLRWLIAKRDIIAFIREAEGEALLVAVARSASEATLDLRGLGFSVARPVFGDSDAAVDGELCLRFDSAASAIWRLG